MIPALAAVEKNINVVVESKEGVEITIRELQKELELQARRFQEMRVSL